jgi:uncharacterized membrane protein
MMESTTTTMASGPFEPLRKISWEMALVAVVGIAFFIRQESLLEGLWINEVVSVDAARLPLQQLLHRTGFFDIHPPFYYVTLWGWTRVLGDADMVVRLLSLVFSLMGLVVLYAWGRMYSRWAALLAVMLLSFSAFHAHYSVEVRCQALLMFLSTCFFFQYEMVVQKRRLSLWFWVGLGLVEGALVLTHYYAAVLLLVANAHFFTVRRFSPQKLYRWTMVQGLAFAAFLSWAPLMLVQFFHLPETMYAPATESTAADLHLLFFGLAPSHPARLIAWLSAFLLLGATIAGLYGSFRTQSNRVPSNTEREMRLPRGRSLAALLVIAVCLAAPALTVLVLPVGQPTAPLLYLELPRAYLIAFIGIFMLLVGNLYNSRGAGEGHPLPATASLTVGTLAILAVLYNFHRPFQPRNWCILLPALYLLAATAWQPRKLLGRTAIVVLIASLAIPSVTRQSRSFLPRQDFRGASTLIAKLSQDEHGTANFVLPMWDRPGVEYYLGAGTANGIMSPSQLPPVSFLPHRVNIVLTRAAFEDQGLFLRTFREVLGGAYQATEKGQSFRNVSVTVFEKVAPELAD